jgi:hypothetical protein
MEPPASRRQRPRSRGAAPPRGPRTRPRPRAPSTRTGGGAMAEPRDGSRECHPLREAWGVGGERLQASGVGLGGPEHRLVTAPRFRHHPSGDAEYGAGHATDRRGRRRMGGTCGECIACERSGRRREAGAAPPPQAPRRPHARGGRDDVPLGRMPRDRGLGHTRSDVRGRRSGPRSPRARPPSVEDSTAGGLVTTAQAPPTAG